MKGKILNKAALRNLALLAAMLALTGLAHAQDNVQAVGPNGLLQAKDAADQKAAKDYISRRETEDQYQKAIREQPSAASSSDPWGSVRPTTPATPAAKSAAKPATKSASSAAKPVKPAVGTTPNQ